MKILLAEDEDDLREVVSAYVEMAGFTVDTAENGAVAVEKAGSDAYDIIIMDIMMPVMDGITAMKKIRESGDITPAIFLTAKAEVSDRIEGLEAGADDYLTKPFSMEELVARLRAMMRRQRDYKPQTLSFHDIELDAEHGELRAHNSISLAHKEVRLLEYLINHAENPLSTAEIFERIWENEGKSFEIVWMYISFLRGKLSSIGTKATITGEKGGSFTLHYPEE